jgi:mannose-6-phosphate isomerase-like protein (cupin superfamily)
MSFPEGDGQPWYPDPVYLGETGEASATVRRADAPAELVYPNGTRSSYLATRPLTGGLFGIYRWDMNGERTGPGPHFHRTMTESFFVLAGTIRIYDGHEWIDARSTDFVHVPEGGIHGFRNESGEPASMLIHFAPGAERESYFEGNAAFAREGRPDADALADFFRAHDNIFLPEDRNI